MQPVRGTGRSYGAWTALLAALLVLLLPTPAFGHGGEDSEEARVLVVDALSYLANKPANYMDGVTDKVGDALEATDTDGVDRAKVEAAQRALDAGDLVRTRSLLQASLEPLSGPVTGEQTGTTTMLDPVAGHTTWDAVSLTLGLLSGMAVLAGLLLAWRWRPAVTLRELRARAGKRSSQ